MGSFVSLHVILLCPVPLGKLDQLIELSFASSSFLARVTTSSADLLRSGNFSDAALIFQGKEIRLHKTESGTLASSNTNLLMDLFLYLFVLKMRFKLDFVTAIDNNAHRYPLFKHSRLAVSCANFQWMTACKTPSPAPTGGHIGGAH